MRTTLRCITVWALATAVAGALAAWLVPGLAFRPAGGRVGAFEALLVSGCSLAGIACTLWLWALVTLVVAEGLRGRSGGAGVPIVVRRAVLGACGLSLVGGLVVPAHADRPAPPPESATAIEALLVGLPVPDRTTTTTQWLGDLASPRPTRGSATRESRGTPHAIRVERGDTLWGLAADRLPTDATTHEIDRRWRAIYHANVDTIGVDPDLIRPGQRLLLPPTATDRR